MLWSFEARNTDERALLTRVPPGVPVIVTDLHQRIVGVNRAWVKMCQFPALEAFGMTPRILQGPNTNVEAARDFSMQLQGGVAAVASLINYRKDGTPFVNHVYGWSIGDLLIAETYAEELL